MEAIETKRFNLNNIDFDLLKNYVRKCEISGFYGINNYKKIQDAREFFYRWHLEQLCRKLSKVRPKESNWLTLNHPEIITLQAMFNRVDCAKETIILQKRFYL